MHKMFGKLLITFFFFMLAFSIFGQADTVTTAQDRELIKPQPPTCEKNDKGDCQAVCNVARNGDGTPNPAGCSQAFKDDVGQGTVCRAEQVTILVGCDLPSGEACTNKGGQQGVWCSCYYRCQDLPQPKDM